MSQEQEAGRSAGGGGARPKRPVRPLRLRRAPRAPGGDAAAPAPAAAANGGTARPPKARRAPQAGEKLPDMSAYARDMQETLRQRSPAAYRAFLARWRDTHDRGVADRLAKMDDLALRLRIERMILDTPALSDLHERSRRYVEEHLRQE